MKNPGSRAQRGFTLIELMVALTIGLFMIGAVISVYIAQTQTYRGTNSQAAIQSAESAIAALVVPTVRTAGFAGCGTVAGAVSNLVAGGPLPLGNLAANAAMVQGYDYNGTAGPGSALAIASDTQANDTNAGHWSPSLDATLAGQVAPGSDVLVVLGPVPDSQPAAVTATAAAGSGTLTVASTSAFPTGQLAAVSDCGKSSVFKVTAPSNATALTHALGAGAMANASAGLTVGYQPGAQVVPLQQTAFFISQVAPGQNVLMRAVLNGTAGATWANPVDELVPGVETMQVLYGIGAAGITTQYVPAGAVPDWTSVYSVRLAFLIEGQTASNQGGIATPPVLLGTTVTPPADSLLRHAYEITINLRNATP
jgi:type IV pilus assembly protein PilW